MTKIIAIALASLIALTGTAQAFDPFYFDEPAPRRKVVKRHHHKPKAPAVMAYQKRYDTKPTCVWPIRVVGSQWATESGAEESAQKAYMERVRYELGESYMDLKNSRDYMKRCSRSSIGELASATLHRCEVIATPCRPALSEGDVK